MPAMTEEQIQAIVREYGSEVSRRERLANHAGYYADFKASDQRCMDLWRQMKALGCYQDEEGSVLKEQYRAAYYG